MATIYWNYGLENIEQWVGNTLPTLYANWLPEDNPLRAEFDNLPDCDRYRISYMQENFDAFAAKFSRIDIRSGLPHNDYGQTIELDSIGDSKFAPSNYMWGAQPGERGGHFPDNFSSELRLEHFQDEKRHRDTIEMSTTEPLSWGTLRRAVWLSGRLSNITLLLDQFVIEWAGNNIRVHIKTLITPHHKPPLGMYR